MDSERWDVSHKPRRSNKKRLWSSVPRKRKYAKKRKENMGPMRSAECTRLPPRHEGILIESNTNEQLFARSSSCQPGGIEITTAAGINNAPSTFNPVIELGSNQVINVEPISQSSSRSSSCQPGGIEITTTAEINAPASFDPAVEPESTQIMNVEPISLSSSRSSSCQPGGIEITTTAEIHALASFDPVIELESNQAMNVVPLSPSYSRNLTPTSTTTSESLIVEKENNTQIEVPELAGRRLIDVKYLFEQLSSLDHSPFNCTFKDFKFVSEHRQGFYSSFKFDCAVCNAKVIIKSDRSGREINQHVVHGIVSSGNGFAQLDEFCAHVDMPCMSDKLFIKENVIFGDIIKDIALESMHQAGIEERKIAIAQGHVDNDGIPYITVVVDGSWAKQSYRTNYNSLSGVSCIIGFETKKVLFLGIRNAYCCVCTLAKNKNTLPKEHRCFKNWAKSSTAMEADGIVEGFKCSLDMHKIKYTTIIGDGDSSVTSALNESLPYGHMTSIKKIECSNHLLRNYCTKLKNLTKKTDNKYGSVPVRLRKLLDTNILRLRKAVKGAVDHTSKLDTTIEQKFNILRQDLLNSPCHVFGDHDKCKSYFCKGGSEENVVPEMKKCGLWYEIYSCLNLIVTNAESLLMAQTNNIAEQFNSIIAKFIGGKRVNYCLRGSYEMRCFAAAAKQNTGNLVKTLAKDTEISTKYLQRNINKNKRKADTDRSAKLRKRNVAVADEHYGNLEKEADIPCDIFNKKKDEFILNLEQSARKRHDIQEMTKGQGSNQEWLRQRKIRLTASYFGQVCKLRSTTSCHNVVKQLLYNKFKGNDATKYGNENEPIALKDAEKLLGLHIEQCGLFIDEKRPYLGASPDGLINDDAIVEIKCPSSASNLSPTEAIDKKKINFCTVDGDNSNKIKLKRNHNYFYQVQGQLQITDRKYCMFIVWTPKGLVYEKIEKDNEFWNSAVSKLEEFYFKCILPELIDPRLPRNLPIRDRK